MNRKDAYIILGIFLFLFLLLSITGTLTSGYHFTDDHEIIRIVDDLKKESTIDVAKKWITEDLAIRYRPMYYLHRVLESKVFGDNIIIWSFYTAFIVFVSLSLFYLSFRRLNFTPIESVCFLVVAFIGPQMEIVWRLGPNETIGILFLSISFYLMTNASFNHTINNVLLSISLIFTSICKESFLIIIPALIFFKVWYDYKLFNRSLKYAIFKNWILTIPIIIMIFNIWVILRYVGTNQTGYAGFGDEGLLFTFKGILSNVQLIIRKYFLVIIFIAICYITLRNRKKDFYFFLRRLIVPFLFTFLIVFPNIVLYAKSSIFERYYLPLAIGIAYFIVIVINEISKEHQKLNKLFTILLMVFFFIPFLNVVKKASRFAKEGKYSNELITSIVSNFRNETKALLVADPVASYEWSYSLKTYLYIKHNIVLYAYPLDNSESEFADENISGWLSWFENRKIENIVDQPDIIVFFDKTLIEQFKNKTKVNLDAYQNLCASKSKFAVLKKP